MSYPGPYLTPYADRHASTLRVARAVQLNAEAKALAEAHLSAYVQALHLAADAQRLLAAELDEHAELHKPITDEDMRAWRESTSSPT